MNVQMYIKYGHGTEIKLDCYLYPDDFFWLEQELDLPLGSQDERIVDAFNDLDDKERLRILGKLAGLH